MENSVEKNLLALLKKEMKPALGVTEPVSVALAAARAYQAVGGELEAIRITVNPALYKTGASVVIPGTDQTGFAMAAVLGTLVGDAGLGFEVLKHVEKESVVKAKAALDKGTVQINIKRDEANIYVEAAIKTNKGHGLAVIRDAHTNIVLVKANDRVVYQKDMISRQQNKFSITSLTVTDLIRFVRDISFEDIDFVLNAVKMNRELSHEGMTGRFGMQVGVSIVNLVREKKLAEDVVTAAEAIVSAACDARLGGAQKPAMSIAGSGLHGLIATLPISTIAERGNIGDEELARAVALSLLITIYIKAYCGRLSGLCGCVVAAGTAASAGIVQLLGGREEQIGYAIKNMAANVTGIICDGANFGCALKISTGVRAAIQAAFIALKNVVVPAGSGIVAEGVDETIINVGRISSQGMSETDRVILDIMTKS